LELIPRSLRYLGRQRYLWNTFPNLLAIRQGSDFDRPNQEGKASRSSSVLEWSGRVPSPAVHVPATPGDAHAGAEAELEDDRQLYVVNVLFLESD
jgi:hypothetical protein